MIDFTLVAKMVVPEGEVEQVYKNGETVWTKSNSTPEVPQYTKSVDT